MPSDSHVWWSRRVNGWLGSDPETMFCSRLYITRSRWEPVLDLVFLVLRGERGHCRQMAEWEAMRRNPGPVDRAREAGM